MSYPQAKPQNTFLQKMSYREPRSAHLGLFSTLSKMEVSLIKRCKIKEKNT